MDLDYVFGMALSIRQRVELANAGRNLSAICKLKSGWVIVGDTQPLDTGYCILLADPIVEGLNGLDEEGRKQYGLDMARVGDALLKVANAHRINYETWGNLDPSLHTHITARFLKEPHDKRISPVRNAYDIASARPFDLTIDGPFIERMRAWLKPYTISEMD